MLCDAVNKEYSRDIEPMCGGYGDAFYIQLIENIRQYKGKQESKQSNPGRALRYRSTDSAANGRDSYGVSQTIRYCQEALENSIYEVVLSDSEDNLMITVSFHRDEKRITLKSCCYFSALEKSMRVHGNVMISKSALKKTENAVYTACLTAVSFVC